MINSDTPKAWLGTRLPGAGGMTRYFTSPWRLREQPYFNTLPVLITAALLFMALSGFVLSLFYDPADGYDSIQFIGRNVNYGWLIQAFHETGTTMIFGAVYLVLFHAMFTRGYRAPGELLWLIGLAQLALLLIVGYLGYVLADGAVSYWSLHGATAGDMAGLPGELRAWFFGGPAGGGTLARLAVFHVVLALATFGIVGLYFAARRAIIPVTAVAHPRVSFHPYYTAQYFTAFMVFALIFGVLLFFAPHLGENPLNQAAANPLILPAALIPPWYLLAATGGGGLLITIVKLALLAALPWLDRSRAGAPPGAVYKVLVVLLALDVIALVATQFHQPSTMAEILGVVFTVYYFLHFLVLTPLVTMSEAK